MEKYTTLRELGRGSYGVATLCTSSLLDAEVVIKTVPLCDLSAEKRQDALNEAHMLSSFDHKNIVKHIESFIEDDQLHIVMEYCEGGNMSDFIQEKRERHGKRFFLPEDTILQWSRQLASALKYLHAHGVLHRDLKTQNIFMSCDGMVAKIGDFGIAKVLSSRSAYARTMVGTPYYLSPEVCSDKPYNAKSDMWSFGCVLYEMCTTQQAFRGESLPAIVMKILRGRYPPLPNLYSAKLKRYQKSDRPPVSYLQYCQKLKRVCSQKCVGLNNLRAQYSRGKTGSLEGQTVSKTSTPPIVLDRAEMAKRSEQARHRRAVAEKREEERRALQERERERRKSLLNIGPRVKVTRRKRSQGKTTGTPDFQLVTHERNKAALIAQDSSAPEGARNELHQPTNRCVLDSSPQEESPSEEDSTSVPGSSTESNKASAVAKGTDNGDVVVEIYVPGCRDPLSCTDVLQADAHPLAQDVQPGDAVEQRFDGDAASCATHKHPKSPNVEVLDGESCNADPAESNRARAAPQPSCESVDAACELRDIMGVSARASVSDLMDVIYESKFVSARVSAEKPDSETALDESEPPPVATASEQNAEHSSALSDGYDEDRLGTTLRKGNGQPSPSELVSTSSSAHNERIASLREACSRTLGVDVLRSMYDKLLLVENAVDPSSPVPSLHRANEQPYEGGEEEESDLLAGVLEQLTEEQRLGVYKVIQLIRAESETEQTNET